MNRWKQTRTAVAGGVAVAVVWAIVALAAPAQNPQPKLTFYPDPPTARPKTEDENLPPIDMQPIVDGNVIPAQGKQPAGVPPRPVAGPPARSGTDVPDPPHPSVTIRVRVPADVAPGDDIKYLITVQNVSSAPAHAVTVRNPLAPEVAKIIKSEPEFDKPHSDEKKQLVWSFGTLKPGQTKTIELVLRHKPDATELKNLAYVRFEHGEAVTTKIAKPTIKVAKTAPKQTIRDEPFTVRMVIQNTGRVPAQDVHVLENLPASAEVEPITAGAKKLQQPEGQQWQWTIARLQPKERKVIEYRVTPRESKDVFTLTSIRGERLVPDAPAEGRTQVLVPGLEVKLTGPSAPVSAGASAKYEIVVRNTGTLPSTNLKITGSIPADCKPTMKTDGGQLFRDTVAWQLPRLEPGEAHSFRFGLKASTTGRRIIAASATDARGQRAGDERATVFTGTAALVWETHFDRLTVRVGKQGVLTVKVKNAGGAEASNVHVRIEVPDAVSAVQPTPNVRIENNVIDFSAQTIPAYGEMTYTLTFEGKKPTNEATFTIQMAADCLGDRPMTTQKSVVITGGPK